jgi:hypothetical protein|tara:strand:+ start:203 stop:454 length:252 start_codon:yes stop_codon:yes gene_type:complete
MALLYLPTAQSRHNAAPMTDCRCPGMQAMHVEEPLFGMLNPSGQSSHAIELAAVLYMPVRQASQVPRPVELENSPGKHELHVL